MSNDRARAAMRNAIEGAEDNDRDTLPLGHYFRELVRLEDEKRNIANDISDLMRAAKSDGHDTKTLKEAHKIAQMLPEDRDLKFQRLLCYLRECAGVVVDLGFYGSEDA